MSAPQVKDLTPLDHQAFVLDEVRRCATALIGEPGRGWGQDALRAMIAQAILDDHSRGATRYQVTVIEGY